VKSGVSRETLAPPAQAAEVFGPALPLAARYAELLAGPGVVRGLIGPREVPRLWSRHLLNCAALAPVVDHVVAEARSSAPEEAVSPVTVVDLGSGAGLPGVVLALVRPTWRVVLLEPLERRTTFLLEVVEELGLPQVQVCRGRAQDPAVVQQVRALGRVDVVTARAVAPLERLAGWALPLLSPGGSLLALKGAKADQELAAASPTLQRMGQERTGTGGAVVASSVWELPGSPSRVIQVRIEGMSL
jgi:16S rRNA (guanine527-N7)-methyltransferase